MSPFAMILLVTVLLTRRRRSSRYLRNLFNTGGFLTAKFDSDWSLQVVVQTVSTHSICMLLYLLPPGNKNDTTDRRKERKEGRMERQLNAASYRVLAPCVKLISTVKNFEVLSGYEY